MHKTLRFATVACGLVLAAASAQAAPFTLTAQLTGDPRAGNPDNLIVDVTVSGDTTSNTANWTVDINSPAHPGVKLDEFAFNMAGLDTDYGFSNFTPAAGLWAITANETLQGGGNLQFMFGANKGANGNTGNVTNSIDLTFTMTKLTGNLSPLDFLGASQSCSNDNVLGCGQLGAHLQSLSVPPGTTGVSDSGVALGNWRDDDDVTVPEPTTMLLLGTGLLMGARRLRRRD